MGQAGVACLGRPLLAVFREGGRGGDGGSSGRRGVRLVSSPVF